MFGSHAFFLLEIRASVQHLLLWLAAAFYLTSVDAVVSRANDNRLAHAAVLTPPLHCIVRRIDRGA
jgi:hypothetical protein